VACIDWLMVWYSCMSREVTLVGHTNISIDGKLDGQAVYCPFCILDMNEHMTCRCQSKIG
jgi:hypothetical protein